MRSRQRGFTLMEMLVVTAIVVTILAIAAPALRNGHVGVSGGEVMAVREMQSVVRAQTQFRTRFGKYTASLDELASTEKGRLPVRDGQDTGRLCGCGESESLGLNGRRSFYVNQNGVVRESRGEPPASLDSPKFQ